MTALAHRLRLTVPEAEPAPVMAKGLLRGW